jgi:hypothetical protein
MGREKTETPAACGRTQRTVTTWNEFRQAFDGVLNFLMAGECVPFSFDMPPVEQVIDEIRRDPDARIVSGVKGGSLDRTDTSEQFRKLPIEEAANAQFQMSHYRLPNLYGSGKLFHGFEAQVMEPWRQALVAAGFTWTRCYPIVFSSGPHSATNYHMDPSNVLAWQRCGTKRFCGMKDPDRWAPFDVRMEEPGDQVQRPEEITDADILCYEMAPGDVLWNVLLTPHWVEASDHVTYSINISHGGLRLDGRLCPHEQELKDFQKDHPEVFRRKTYPKTYFK